jgi:hypothetical protein
VEWCLEQEEVAKQKVIENSSIRASEDEQAMLENEADKMWDSFYGIHQNRYVI